MTEGTDMIENVVARIIMENRDNGRCIVKDWEAEERDNPHVAQALRQSRAVIAAIAAMTVPAEPVAWKNYAEDGDWWLTDDREPADSCERSVPLYAFPTPPAGGSDGTES